LLDLRLSLRWLGGALCCIVLWDVMSCRLVEVFRTFRGTYRLHFQGRKLSQTSSKFVRLASADFWQTSFMHKKNRNWITSKCMYRNGQSRRSIITKRKWKS
jgi:hypothetical protein